MLSRKEMMRVFKEKAIIGPKTGVTKRKKGSESEAVSGSIVSVAEAGGRQKKQKRILDPNLQRALDRQGNVELPEFESVPSSGEEQSPERKIEDLTGDEPSGAGSFAEEIAPGVKSISAGLRPPIKQPSVPEGPMGWSTLDMRTYEGWMGAGPRPLDTTRAFNIPSDLEAYRQMDARAYDRYVRTKAGELMSAIAGGFEKREDLRLEAESQRRKASKAVTDLGLAEAQLKLAQEKGKLFEAQVKELNLEVGKRNHDLADSHLALKRLETEKESWESGKAELELLKKENEELKGRPSGSGVDYVDCVKRFLKTKTFAGLLNRKAAPSYEMGFKDLAGFIGVGNAFDPEAHSYAKFVEAEMEKEDDGADPGGEEPDQAGPSAPLSDEIPLNELLSEAEDEDEQE